MITRQTYWTFLQLFIIFALFARGCQISICVLYLCFWFSFLYYHAPASLFVRTCQGRMGLHRSCLSCTGKCSFYEEWSSATWCKAMNCRTFHSQKGGSRSSRSCSCGSGSVVSCQSGESHGIRDIFPHAPDQVASGHLLV